MRTHYINAQQQYTSYKFFYFTLLLLLLPGFVFSQVDRTPNKISVVVRDFETDRPIPNVILEISNGASYRKECQTLVPGYTEIRIRQRDSLHWRNGDFELTYFYPIGTGSGCTIKLNPFMTHYELYTPAPPEGRPYNPAELTADIHLQTSLRAHNLFAQRLYINQEAAPGNLNWFTSYKGRTSLHRGKWYEADLEELSNHRLLENRKRMMEAILCDKPASCKGSTNTLKDYTQATYSHLKIGKVALSFNPITPIEKSVANTWFRRLVNSQISGLSMSWLEVINGPMSHWENFEKEYNMLMSLSKDYNHFKVRFYTSGMDLDTNLTTIVNCAEGGHILHGPLMANKIDHITSKPKKTAKRIIYQHLDSLKYPIEIYEVGKMYNYFASKIGYAGLDNIPGNVESLKKRIDTTTTLILNPLADTFLLTELLNNVQRFKDTSKFQIWLLNIAHHTYNHMFGHAVAFDQGNGIGNFLAKFMHNSHTSNEHYATWRRMYYNIDGPNEFGKRVMDSLITRNNQGHRILIDLKHSGYSTRKWFLEEVIKTHFDSTGERIPPVCSHCAANGQKEIEYSRYVDEFQLRNAPIAHTFYPFELNLYNEEITRIFQEDGLIGIKLEQRGLGGYINKHRIWPIGLKQNGEFKKHNDTSMARRFSYVRRWLRHYRNHDPGLLAKALDYIHVELGVDKGDFALLESDYISVEPFLQNLFHFIDHSGKAPYEAWKQLCIGSDLDGVIDPIDICPTASQYPEFKKRLRHFIPIFLRMRHDIDPKNEPEAHYFSPCHEIDDMLNHLFFLSAKNFVEKNFIN